MRYFVPNLKLSSELPAQSGPIDKLGGIPWGLVPDMWPKCRDCGKSQSLLAQFIHHPVRLDLGKEGRVLNVFQCNHNPGICSNWEGGAGANACFIIDPENLLDGVSALPEDSPPLEREAFITDWQERDDGIDPKNEPSFYSWERYSQLAEEETNKLTPITKIGSVPWWVQSPDETPQGNWQFIGQLSGTYFFSEPPACYDRSFFEDTDLLDLRSYHCCDGPNFGGGIGYIFLRETALGREGWFFWQC